jgi:hypothetical protein
MTKEMQSQNDEEVVLVAFVLIISHSFGLRHSDFVIRTSAFLDSPQMNDR